MTNLTLHRFGAKYSIKNGKRTIEPDFDVEQTDSSKRRYVFGIELDLNDRDDKGFEIANSNMRYRLKGKSLTAVKALLDAKPKAQAFKSVTKNRIRNETYSYCDHCIPLIHAAVNI